MNPALLILLPLILAVFLAGGFTKSPIKNNASLAEVFTLEEKTGIDSKNVLQIQNLIPKPTSTPAPTTSGPTLTPTPTGIAFTTITPTTTPAYVCPSKKVVVHFLLDTSGSMGTANKIGKLQEVLSPFPEFISQNIRVGIQQYSDPRTLFFTYNALGAKTVLPIGIYNKSDFSQKINSLSAGGATHMKDGFIIARDEISSKRSQSSYSGYDWYMILVSDGVPFNIDPIHPDHLGKLDNWQGPDPSQNPTLGANEAQQIKNMGIKIITVGLGLEALNGLSSVSSSGIRTHPGDTFDYTNFAKALLTTIQTHGFYNAPSAENLRAVFQSITQKVCQ